ncbi:MAG TPA: hypothetical protein VM659_04320 [Dongiaceae bacterium]|nr:hypothetical protein [Dongiaceae bacterium]
MKDQMQHHSRSSDRCAGSLDSNPGHIPQHDLATGTHRPRWIVAIAFLALGACSLPPYSPPPGAKAPPPPKPYAGAQPRFAKPAIANYPRLVLNEAQVRGHRVQVIDEDGPFWVNLSHSHDATAGQGNQVKVTDGRWWIGPSGLLCLRSSVWWKDGTCFELFGGHQFAEATVIHSLNRDNGPNTYYPFTVVGPAN